MDGKKKRLLIIVLSGVAIIGFTLFLSEESAPATQSVSPASTVATTGPASSPASPNAVGRPNTSTLPKGAASAGQRMRNIFSPPTEYQVLLPPTNASAPRAGSGQTFSAGPAPLLTGVIAGEGTRVAILRQGTISRSYRVGESAGAFRVESIGSNSVTLAGPSGTKILTIGQ